MTRFGLTPPWFESDAGDVISLDCFGGCAAEGPPGSIGAGRPIAMAPPCDGGASSEGGLTA